MFKCCKIVSTVIVFQLLLFPYVYAEEKPVRKNIAVVEFQTKGDLGIKDAGSIIAEWMISGLLKTNKFNLKERVLLKKVLEEQVLETSGLVDEKTLAAQAGKIYGVEAIVTGSVLKWGDIISVTTRLIDTKTGAILLGADVKTKDVNRIPDKIDQLAEFIAGIRKELPQDDLTVAATSTSISWKTGDRALINWSRDSYWYPGVIQQINNNLYFIHFDDGDKEWVDSFRIRPDDIKPGDRVYGNWKNKGRYYPGTVTKRSGLSIHISYDDGDQEDTTISLVRLR